MAEMLAYGMLLLSSGLVAGFLVVAFNPSPYFAALGLMVAAGLGCGLLVWCGVSLLALVLFLIYLGGMLVVFAYAVALASEIYPENVNFFYIMWGVLMYVLVMGLLVVGLGGDGNEGVGGLGGWDYWYNWWDTWGLTQVYTWGGVLVLGGWMLLLTLFVVLELTRGLMRGALRAV